MRNVKIQQISCKMYRNFKEFLNVQISVKTNTKIGRKLIGQNFIFIKCVPIKMNTKIGRKGWTRIYNIHIYFFLIIHIFYSYFTKSQCINMAGKQFATQLWRIIKWLKRKSLLFTFSVYFFGYFNYNLDIIRLVENSNAVKIFSII